MFCLDCRRAFGDNNVCPLSVSLPFIMAPPSFDDRIGQLLQYENENGHMFVPSSYKENGNLGNWVKTVRANYKRGFVKKEKIDKLDTIGFTWIAPKGPEKKDLIEWSKHYKWVSTFKTNKGHCNVPAKIAGKDVPAASWCHEQRQLQIDNKLDKSKYDKLMKLGFDFYWSPSATAEDNDDNNSGDNSVEEPVSIVDLPVSTLFQNTDLD